MSVSQVLNSALTGLQVNQASIGVVSTNIANVNTPDYARREVQQQAQVLGSQSAGVDISEVRRIVDRFIQAELLNAESSSASAEAINRFHSRVQSFLGAPDSETNLASQVTTALNAIADLSVEPNSSIRRNNYLGTLTEMTQTFAQHADQIQDLRRDADAEIEDQVRQINSLITQIHELNPQIVAAEAESQGRDATGLFDQRDAAIRELSQFVDIRVTANGDGSVNVATSDGVSLVGTNFAQLSYSSPITVTAATRFPQVELTQINAFTGQPIGPARDFEPNLQGGSLRGLLEVRDEVLPNLSIQIGTLSAQLTESINAVHNNNVSVPAPNSLTGINTGLLAGDAHNFSGRFDLAVTDANGALVRRLTVDFDAGANGEVSVDGGPPAAIGGATIGDLATALDTALGAEGTVTFANGALSLSAATPGNGIALLNDAAAPAERGGRGFSQVFGLNNLLTAARPSSYATGLSATDLHGFTPGETVDITLAGPVGSRDIDRTLTIPAGTTFADLVTALNDPATGFGNQGTFSLDGDGRLDFAPNPGFSDFHFEIGQDSTSRGAAGVSFSSLFGLGRDKVVDQANGLEVVSTVIDAPERLALAQLDLSGGGAVGDTVLAEGDNRGAQALQALSGQRISFDSAGSLGAINATFGNYAGTVLAEAGRQAAAAEAGFSAASGLAGELQERSSEIQGVNLDEELSRMVVLQQAFNASARLIATATELLDEVLNIR